MALIETNHIGMEIRTRMAARTARGIAGLAIIMALLAMAAPAAAQVDPADVSV